MKIWKYENMEIAVYVLFSVSVIPCSDMGSMATVIERFVVDPCLRRDDENILYKEIASSLMLLAMTYTLL